MIFIIVRLRLISRGSIRIASPCLIRGYIYGSQYRARPRTRSERRCERRQRLLSTALNDECSLKPRLQLQRLVLVIREIRPRHRRIHISDIALVLDISLRLAVYSRNTIFKY